MERRSRAQEAEAGSCGTGPGRGSPLAERKHRENPVLLAGKGQRWPPSSTSEPDVNQVLKCGQELWTLSWAGGLQLVG